VAIRSAGDILTAFNEGRWHTQRFTKNAGQTGDNQWQDWAYASGQPAYDARIGTALAFTPDVATRNDAIWFPPIDSSMERRLIGLRTLNTASGTGQLQVEYQMYDLLGHYPLIDGDSTDVQGMDNTQTLPRYTDGEGVQAILVNHVAPATAVATYTINYVNNNGNDRTMTGFTTTYGVGNAAHTLASAGSAGPLYCPLDARCRGVRSVTSISFDVPPGGLWCIYLVRPLTSTSNRGGAASVTQTNFTEKCLCAEDSFRLPRIYDGAHLGFFYMPTGSARTVSLFGTATFIWG
jgi:hypothetical protein